MKAAQLSGGINPLERQQDYDLLSNRCHVTLSTLNSSARRALASLFDYTPENSISEISRSISVLY